jgi:ABC-2 type transport system ATP-binding protein
VSLDIEEGEFFGLLGPNGAGKTTLISILAGLARATSGRVLVQGSDVQADYADARRKLGIVPQELVFDPFFNVREALRFQSGYFGVKNNDDWIDELLAAWAWPTRPRQHAPALGRHEAPRAGGPGPGAQAAHHRAGRAHGRRGRGAAPDAVAVHRRLNKQGHTVLLTTHYLEEAEALCSRMAMLKRADQALDHAACSSRLQQCAAVQDRCRLPRPWPPGAGHRPHRADCPPPTPAMWSACWPRCARAGDPRTWKSAAPIWRMCSSTS